ncbi:MAG: hypothetical protein J4473_00170 [Candidatus Aenigmarchaeota archaeon]|nr:hypothetical protein [Candidatus Aenigmarchaeota archaeon]
MPKRKLSDMVFLQIDPPDYKQEVNLEDLSHVIVQRLGLKRKQSKADHSKLLRELIKYKKDNVPVTLENIACILGVSQSQTYEEIRKWRTLGLIEFVKLSQGNDYIKGYMLGGNTTNRLLDKVESSFKSFIRETRRIAKDFDDLVMLDSARSQRRPAGPDDEPEEPNEPEIPVIDEEKPRKL